jgi:outer membrane autotransporter protein
MLRGIGNLALGSVGLALFCSTNDGARAKQSLDQAVAEQVTDGCAELLGENTVDELKGQLQALCVELGFDLDSPPVGAASGGGAATPASAPGIIQQQLRERLLAAAEQSRGAVAASGDSAGGGAFDHFSVFALGSYAAVDKNRNSFEDGYDSDILGATVGGSYRIRPDVVAGLAFDYFHEDGNFDTGGDFDTRSFGLVAFGSVSSDHLVIQGSIGYARRAYERTRRIDVTFEEGRSQDAVLNVIGDASGNYDGNAYFMEAAATSIWQWRNVTLSPSASLGWSRIDFDSYKEDGDTGLELRFDDDHQTFLISSLGIGASTVFSAGPVALVPSVNVSWLHEFENDQRTIKVNFVDDKRPKRFSYSTEKPDRNFGLLRAGLATVLPNGLRPVIQFQTVFENTNYSSYLATIGLNFDL